MALLDFKNGLIIDALVDSRAYVIAIGQNWMDRIKQQALANIFKFDELRNFQFSKSSSKWPVRKTVSNSHTQTWYWRPYFAMEILHLPGTLRILQLNPTANTEVKLILVDGCNSELKTTFWMETKWGQSQKKERSYLYQPATLMLGVVQAKIHETERQSLYSHCNATWEKYEMCACPQNLWYVLYVWSCCHYYDLNANPVFKTAQSYKRYHVFILLFPPIWKRYI